MSFKGYCYSFSFLLFLFAGATPDVSQASSTSYDISRDYICGSCTDRQSTLQFVREYVTPKQCRTDSRGPGPGGGLRPRMRGQQNQVGEQSPARFRTCSGPDERAIIMNPETNRVRVFIVQRGTQARDGMPPLAFPRSGLLSRAERTDRLNAMELYREYIEMRDDVNESLAGWMREQTRRAQNRKDLDLLACSEQTALAHLGDLAKWSELKSKMRREIRERYSDRFRNGARVVVSGGYMALSGGPIEAGVSADIERASDLPEAVEQEFFVYQTGTGFNDIEDVFHDPDRLVFEFMVRRFPDGDLSIELELNESTSRIHGRVGFLSESGNVQNPEALNRCALNNLNEALRTHVLSGNTPSAGGYSGGLYRLFTGSGPTWTTWICGSGTCCELNGSTCLPEREVRGF